MNDILKTVFNDEATIYDETTQYLLLDYELILKETVNKMGYSSDAEFSILDLGCGTGNLSKLIRERYYNAEIYALDFSDTMLSKFKGKDISNIHYIHADMFDIEQEHLPFFDVIVSSFVFHNFEKISDHNRIMKIVNQHLSINGKIIITDLVDLINPNKRKDYQLRLINAMRKHGLANDEIVKWMGILEMEDSPLSIEKNVSLLYENEFENINISMFENSGSAIFTGIKKMDSIQLKLELLIKGIKKNKLAENIYFCQNPQQVRKTGNNGIFLTVNGLNILVSINHESNRCSPYEIEEHEGRISLKKNKVTVTEDVTYMKTPDWFLTAIPELSNQPFANFFVLEGDRFLHLAYKGCSFDLKEKCKFCSTRRRVGLTDNTAEDVCKAISYIIDQLPQNIHICLGGGTYKPFDDNVKYFSEIIRCIRAKRIDIPIWVECIPPSIDEIEKLIDDGATAFGFNIEIWDDKNREIICPGKSEISKSEYIVALKYAVDRLGINRVGSCIIVGLDSFDSVKAAIDSLVEIGVEPCVLPYKKYDGTNLGEFKVSKGYQYDFYQLSKYAAQVSKEHNIVFEQNQGCLKCTCCTVMHDIQNII